MLMSNPAMTAATSGFKEIGANFSVSRLQFPSAGTGSGCIISFVRELQWRFGGCCSIFGVEPLSNRLVLDQVSSSPPQTKKLHNAMQIGQLFPQSSYKILDPVSAALPLYNRALLKVFVATLPKTFPDLFFLKIGGNFRFFITGYEIHADKFKVGPCMGHEQIY